GAPSCLGGGLNSDGPGVRVVGSTISGNSAAGSTMGTPAGNGGGVSVRGGSSSFLNCTIANNSANANGGGIFASIAISSAVHLWIEFSTVAGNVARFGGGIYSMPLSPDGPRLRNSIVANNTATGLTGPDLTQDFQSSGYNLIGTNTGFTFDVVGTGPDGQANTASGNQIGVLPALGTFGDLGGPTMVFPLQAGSQALAAGTCTTILGTAVTTDQRGLPRRATYCDIGAVEGTGSAFQVVAVSAEPAGGNCTTGGTRIQSGWDANGSGVLDAFEVTRTAYACNGQSGLRSLVAASNEPPGTNCASGGKRITAGVDLNANAVLEAGEVTSTAYVCNGLTGASGVSSLVRLTAVPAGANCAAGGNLIEVGLDANGNGLLDTAEITSATYVCNGTAGAAGASGQTSLVSQSAEPAAANCAAGGVKISTGLDTNGNGTLEPGEVAGTSYVCRGSDGASGKNALVTQTSEPPGANCQGGGVRIQSGVDSNGDGALDGNEVANTTLVCNAASGSNGTNGTNALVTVTPEPAGSNCATGGQRVDTGPDKNANGVLEPDEATGSAYLCSPPPAARGCAASSSPEKTGLIPFVAVALVLLVQGRRRACASVPRSDR
ncbi:MAG: DUF7151 family protein, partial [Myxococcaceae bacterium]